MRKNIGFVPTMGALHEGHLSLIEASTRHNDITVCSIYVNPTQFNNTADLQNYPRSLQQDINLLEELKCDVLFVPDDTSIYKGAALTSFSFGYLDSLMEGRYRKGHFNGVALIVTKLLNVIAPDEVYFGQKDLQQFLIIKQLVKDLSINVNLNCLPIVREPDGLAMSSRNIRLSKDHRKAASGLYKALNLGRSVLLKEKDVVLAKNAVRSFIGNSPNVELEYFEILDSDTLHDVVNLDAHHQVSLFIAGYLGQIRLIDNVFLHQF